MSTRPPPGWPASVPAPGVQDWERAAAQYLLDLCPPDFRAHPVLRRHPVALAWLAQRHLHSTREALARSLATARADLVDVLPPPALTEVLRAIEKEQARVLAAVRAVALLRDALHR